LGLGYVRPIHKDVTRHDDVIGKEYVSNATKLARTCYVTRTRPSKFLHEMRFQRHTIFQMPPCGADRKQPIGWL